jgi:hypothetical protein
VGDVCDALIDDGWWEGCRVVELQVTGVGSGSGCSAPAGLARQSMVACCCKVCESDFMRVKPVSQPDSQPQPVARLRGD